MRARRTVLAAMATTGLMALVCAAASPARPPGERLYFLTASGRTLLPVERPLGAAAARTVVTALLAGPTSAERNDGATAVVPRGVRLASLRRRGRGLQLSLRGAALLRLSTIPRLRVIAAFTYTLTSLRGIERVRFTVDRRPWGVYDLHSRLIRDYTRATLQRAMTACAPGEGCFTP